MSKKFLVPMAASILMGVVPTLPVVAQNQKTEVANASVNLMLNGSFEEAENGAPSAWYLPPEAALSSEYSQDGKTSLKIVAGTADATPYAAQSITNFEKDKRYRLRYHVRGDRFGVTYRVYIGMWRKQGDEQVWVSGADTGWRQGRQDWQDIKFDFSAPQTAERLQIVVQVQGPATVWFDNFSLTPAPEIKTLPAVKPFLGSSKFVQITKTGRFRVAGKPFFPIMLWGLPVENDERMKQARLAGYNVVGPYLSDWHYVDKLGIEGTRKWFDMAERNKLMTMLPLHIASKEIDAAEFLSTRLPKLQAIVAGLKDHPALFMQNISDEPAWGGVDLDSFAKAAYAIREADPNHPIFVNHAPRNSVQELRFFNAYTDITGSDIYPVWSDGIDKHSDLPNKTLSVVGDEVVKNLQAADFKKPVIQTLQAFSWSDGKNATEKNQPFPTASQLRFMAYDAIAAGANGIAFFQDERYDTVRMEVQPTLSELHLLSRVLTTGSDVSTQHLKMPDTVRLRAFRDGADTVFVLTNKMPGEVNLMVDLAPLKLRRKTLIELFEKREVTLSENKLSMKLAPFAVQVFSDAKSAGSVLKTP